MKSPPLVYAKRYKADLRRFLKRRPESSLEPARILGSEARANRLPALELAMLHEQTLVNTLLADYPPDGQGAILKRAGKFFGAVLASSSKTRNGQADAATTRLERLVGALSQRSVALAASNRDLSLEIDQRKAAEEAIKKSEHHYAKLLEQPSRLQAQLRRLSRKMLSAQEEERKRISRELHDVIAQPLTGINIRLLTLKKEAALNTAGLDRNIALTQQLVERSMNIVHPFARELRPALLDDLGLIVALHACMKSFTGRTGVRTRPTAFAEVERWDTACRTVLFRVAQEAASNAGRHAHASRVDVSIQKTPAGIKMAIQDDGTSFNVERVWLAHGGKRIGLLGMRERLRMVGGTLDVASAFGKGTTIEARFPFGKSRGGSESRAINRSKTDA